MRDIHSIWWAYIHSIWWAFYKRLGVKNARYVFPYLKVKTINSKLKNYLKSYFMLACRQYL